MKRGPRPETSNLRPAPGEIDALDVDALRVDAADNGEKTIAALALEALEEGRSSDAWSRCARILAAPIPYRLTA